MPTTVAAALVLACAIFPGFLGSRVYESFIGLDWRERDWRAIVRLAGFSVVGIVIYIAGMHAFPLPPPLHLFPSTFENLTPTSTDIGQLAASFSGHLLGSVIAGGLAVAGTVMLARFASASVYPGAWDDFARTRVRDHWVVVGLNNGEVYAGKLTNADVAVASGDRDLVVEEPCRFEHGRYVAENYQLSTVLGA